MSSPQFTPPSLAGKSAGLAEYLKRAFLHRWNLLLFTGGLVAAGLTPVPDALVPMVLAVEVAYLGGWVAHPRFREAVDAQVYKEIKAPQAVAASQSLASVVGSLSLESRKRFEQVRDRCLEMRSIAQGVRGGQGKAGEDLSTP